MPLSGIFGSEKKRPVPVTSSGSSSGQEKEMKGQQLVVGRHAVIVERKLAEGSLRFLCSELPTPHVSAHPAIDSNPRPLSNHSHACTRRLGEYSPQDGKLEIYNTGLKEKWKWSNQNEAKPIFYKFIRGNLA